MIHKYFTYLVVAVLISSLHLQLSGQDVLVKSNGSILKVYIIDITKDSIKFRNAYASADFTFVIHQSDVKLIEYQNGEVTYFDGSYQNLSFKDTISSLNQINFDDYSLLIDSVLLTFQNLFSQHNLVFDFMNYHDTTLIVEKGKVSFNFISEKKSFTQRLYPTDEKIVFTKFISNYPTLQKHHRFLAENKVISISIYFDEKSIELFLTDAQSDKLMDLFNTNPLID